MRQARAHRRRFAHTAGRSPGARPRRSLCESAIGSGSVRSQSPAALFQRPHRSLPVRVFVYGRCPARGCAGRLLRLRGRLAQPRLRDCGSMSPTARVVPDRRSPVRYPIRATRAGSSRTRIRGWPAPCRVRVVQAQRPANHARPVCGRPQPACPCPRRSGRGRALVGPVAVRWHKRTGSARSAEVGRRIADRAVNSGVLTPESSILLLAPGLHSFGQSRPPRPIRRYTQCPKSSAST